MMKKAVCYIALCAANILLVAHIAIPHHHHENAGVCLFDTHCKDSKEAHHHEQHDTHNHEHERNPFLDKCCIIDDIYAPTHNNIKLTCRFHTSCDCEQTLYALISTPLYTHDFVDDIIVHFRQNPFVPLFFSEFISQSIGLRAPPAC